VRSALVRRLLATTLVVGVAARPARVVLPRVVAAATLLRHPVVAAALVVTTRLLVVTAAVATGLVVAGADARSAAVLAGVRLTVATLLCEGDDCSLTEDERLPPCTEATAEVSLLVPGARRTIRWS
jgi:hypothetical protein